jgi:hypothetical protein
MKQATIASVFLVLLATAVFFALRPGDVKRPYSADAGLQRLQIAARALRQKLRCSVSTWRKS